MWTPRLLRKPLTSPIPRVKRSEAFDYLQFHTLTYFVLQLLQEYGLDFRYLLDNLLSEQPKEQIQVTTAFSFKEHRLSKDISSTSFAKQIEVRSSSSPLQSPPPVPTISAAPPAVNRRRTPAPPNLPSLAPLSAGTPDSLHPLSSGLKSPTVISPQSNSAFSSRFDPDHDNNNTTPLYSARPPPSAMARARTPVSASQQPSTPGSAPIPGVPVASPLPRPTMSATPYRTRERSDSFKDREGSESYRERPPRSARASPVPRSPVALPPRSANRPGSSVGQRAPIAVAQHEGMI